ncbi:MAG: DDE-type integrase/transposase/recombinase [Solirubrobacterales bacterium]
MGPTPAAATRVERPDQLWHMDMTSIWVAEHGWCYLNAIVDCCTREIPAFGLDLRCRRQEAEAVVDRGRRRPFDPARSLDARHGRMKVNLPLDAEPPLCGEPWAPVLTTGRAGSGAESCRAACPAEGL